MIVTVWGAGSWGSALAFVLAEAGHEVRLWGRNEKEIGTLATTRENTRYLPGIRLPEGVSPTTDPTCLGDSALIVMSVPSHTVRENAKHIAAYTHQEAIIVNTAKGLEEGTHLRLSQVISQELPGHRVAALSGPSHAEEVGLRVPTAIVAAGERPVAEFVQDAFMTEYFRVYTSEDLIGVELGGALKNIIALCSGTLEGMNSRDNTKAALITRGAAEIMRLGVALGAEASTFIGLAGIGDLIVTCMSKHSRNLRAGRAIGAGKTLTEALAEVGMVVEGVRNTKVAYELSKIHRIEMPITAHAYQVLFENLQPAVALKRLMGREKKHEREEYLFT
jgi:glycerol-3-phosphate dehydrogenase (NAD(P)+)